ncbi:MAG TPA: hypothetical protein VF723_06475 [Pyrinomonadaceae bacterium]|jgi:hypothetical protein
MPSSPLVSAVAWLDRRILDNTELNPALFARLDLAQQAQGLLYGTRPLCAFLRPYLVSRSQYAAVAEAAETLAGAFERMVKFALKDDGLLGQLGLTERETRMARIDPGYQRLCVSSRLDAFLTDDGFQFLEYNAENPSGITDQMLLETVFFGLPHIKEFLATHAHWLPRPHQRLLDALLETYRRWGGTEERPGIGIVDWDGVSTASEFETLKSYFEAEGYPTVIADPRELSYDGVRLTAREFRIDILYKRVVIHEFLEKFDETHPLARAYAERRVCMANSFRSKVAHKKAGFAILSDPVYEHLFTPEQLTCIRRHIPWTRLVRPGSTTFKGDERDLMDILRRERERMVLKPNDDYGGAGIYFGWERDEREWEEAITLACQRPYVVQERTPFQKTLMPVYTDRVENREMLVDFDPFLFLNRVEGGLVRLSSSFLCNVTSGGGETALLVLEDC